MQSVSITMNHLEILGNHPILGEPQGGKHPAPACLCDNAQASTGRNHFRPRAMAGTQLIAVLSGRAKDHRVLT